MNIVYKIILKYEGKEYECEAPAWWDEIFNEYRSAYELDGIRSCEHDYAGLLPKEIVKDKDFGCEQNEIEIIDSYYYDKETHIRY